MFIRGGVGGNFPGSGCRDWGDRMRFSLKLVLIGVEPVYNATISAMAKEFVIVKMSNARTFVLM